MTGTNTSTIEQVYDGKVVAGRTADVGPGDIAVRQDVAKAYGWELGASVTMMQPATGI